MKINIAKNIECLSVYDKEIDLFEGQYKLKNGVTYNSYVILDEKITIMDTVDLSKSDEWIVALDEVLGDRKPHYFVCLHMEPDHGGSIAVLIDRYPELKIVGSAKTFQMMEQFFGLELGENKVVVKEGDCLELGERSLNFCMAPMVHWPEVMVAYEAKEGILFSADAFGTFEPSSDTENWEVEARRYYFNIVGKYGVQVQSLLKKASTLDIKKICPLHGTVLEENLGFYVEKYMKWSSYDAESSGVLIAYGSFYGNTKTAAQMLKQQLNELGESKVVLYDLAREDLSYALADAFQYDKIVLASASYDGGAFPAVEDFLHHLKAKNYQKRKVAYIENGTWAPSAIRAMKGIVDEWKEMDECGIAITIKSSVKAEDEKKIKELAKELLAN